MRLAIAGGGYVGLATATGFAEQGHQVHVLEIDQARTELLKRGCLPFRDKSLAAAFHDAVASGSIQVAQGYLRLGIVDFAFVCVPTPPAADGSLDMQSVWDSARCLRRALCGPLRLVVRSTLNPGTAEALEQELKPQDCRLLVNPEFLREGLALADFRCPGRVVIGAGDRAQAERLARLYAFNSAPVLLTDLTSAETIKLASNASLALRVAMVNEIARVASAAGADPEAVLAGVGLDGRIGSAYLRPGIGFGGGCLPKDLQAFRAAAARSAVQSPLFDAASWANELGIEMLRGLLRDMAAEGVTRIGIAGLAFKPGSDSIRSSAAVELARLLLADGFELTLFDPLAGSQLREAFGGSVEYASCFQEVLARSHVCLVLDASLGQPCPGSESIVLDALGRTMHLPEAGMHTGGP